MDDRQQSLAYQLGPMLLHTFKKLNPLFQYDPKYNPKRILTYPCSPLMDENQYDNKEYNYILHVNDVIFGRKRYIVLDLLGKGTFGQVAKCLDTSTDQIVALKIIKNHIAYNTQGHYEAGLLEMLNEKYPSQYPIVHLLDKFVFRDHLCLVFELLGISLYELIKYNRYRGLSLNSVRLFVKQILTGLEAFSQLGVIHCDLKPENILLVDNNSARIKIIDLGSACQEGQIVYSYIQSRFYRSPEVILGLSYNSKIDIWSLGCICFELFYGLPLFPGQNQREMLYRFTAGLNCSPRVSVLSKGKNTELYYNTCLNDPINPYSLKSEDQYNLEFPNEAASFKDYFYKAVFLDDIVMGYPYRSNITGKEWEEEIKQRKSMLHMMKLMLQWNPKNRYSPSELLSHPFIKGEPLENFKERPKPNKQSKKIERNSGLWFRNNSNNSSPSNDDKDEGHVNLGTSPRSEKSEKTK